MDDRSTHIGQLSDDEAESSVDAAVAAAGGDLHDALKDRASLATVRAIVEGCPDAGRLLASGGRTNFLHLAAMHSSPGDVVAYLVDQDPGAPQQRMEARGFLPLHMAVAEGSPVETVQAIAEAWTPALMEKTESGYTPLYLAVIKPEVPLEVVEYLATAEPRALQVVTPQGLTPLHAAANAKAPTLAVIRVLTKLHPGALQARTPKGNLPLHLAAMHAGRDVVELLTDKYPKALKKLTSERLLPLHIAAKSNGAEVVEFLLSRNQAALRAAGKCRGLPLHFAAEHNDSAEVVQILLNRHLAAARVAKRSGWLPLHCAARKGNPKTVHLLVEAYPEGLHKGDLEGRRPLQVAERFWSADTERMEVLRHLLDPDRPPPVPRALRTSRVTAPTSSSRSGPTPGVRNKDSGDEADDEHNQGNDGTSGTGGGGDDDDDDDNDGDDDDDDDDDDGMPGLVPVTSTGPSSRLGWDVRETSADAGSASLFPDDGIDERGTQGTVDELPSFVDENGGPTASAASSVRDDDLPPLMSAVPVPRNGCWVLSPSGHGSSENLQYAFVEDNEIVFDRVVTRTFRGGTHLIRCRSGTKAYVYEPMPDSVPELWQVSLASSFGGTSIPAIPLYQLPFDPSKSELLANPNRNDVWVLTKETGSNWRLFEATFREPERPIPLLEFSNENVKLVAADDAGGWLHVEGSVDDAERPGALAPGLWYVHGDTLLPTRPEPLHRDDWGKDVHFTSALEGHGVWALSLRNEASGSARCKLSLVTVEGEDDEARIVSRTKNLDFPFHRVRHAVAAPGGVFLHCKPSREGGTLQLRFANLSSSAVTVVVDCPRSCTLLSAQGGCWTWKKVGGSGRGSGRSRSRRPHKHSLSFVVAEENFVVESARTFPAGSVISTAGQ